MKHSILIPTALLLAGITAATDALSATIRVERWGQDLPQCGSKAEPCQTIQHAISERSGANDRILVGPGYYEENIVIDQNSDGEDLSGLKLESVNGRHTTIIRTALPDTHGIEINQPGVRIGRKNRGLTVGGADSAGYAAIRTIGNLDGIRIEGNRVILSTTGIFASGPRIQIRHNIAELNNSGIVCVNCADGLIRDNQSRRNLFSGFQVNLSDGIRVHRNYAAYNASRGFDFADSSEYVRVEDNVSEYNSVSGFMLHDADGSLSRRNIAQGNQQIGFGYNQSEFTASPRIQHNLAVANGLRGIEFFGLSDGVVENNTAISNQIGFDLNAGIGITGFRRNNSVASATGCGIRNDSGSPLHVERHYYGSADGADPALDGDNHDGVCGTDPAGGDHATKMNRTVTRVAEKL